MKYEVIETFVYQHTSGRRTYPSDATEWKRIPVGWTVRNPINGQIGVGAPCVATREQAQRLADRLGTPSRIGLGD